MNTVTGSAAMQNSAERVKHTKVNVLNYAEYEHLVAGISGGVTSTLILHPLDIIKIRFAVNDGRLHKAPTYKGIVNAFVTMLQQERLKGLYRGVTPNVIGAGSSWGLYFFFYNILKQWTQNLNGTTILGPIEHLTAASEAGIATLLITNPIWVVKTRLCLQYGSDFSKSLPSHVKYDGMIDAFKKIYRTDGFRGYYKGLVPGIFGVSHGAVQFMVYEELKNSYSAHYKLLSDEKLGTTEYLTFAAVSKLIAVIVTYPYQVLRARLQNQHCSYQGTWHCVIQTWLFEGWKGFYKGMGTNLLRVTPATMITFLTYENVSHLLKKKHVLEKVSN